MKEKVHIADDSPPITLEQLFDFLSSKGINSKCNFCGSENNWEFPIQETKDNEHTTNPTLSIFKIHEKASNKNDIECIAINCTNCGNVLTIRAYKISEHASQKDSHHG